MLQYILRPIRKVFNALGYEVIKKKYSVNAFQLGKWLIKLNINTIIDIGANEGQFTQSINNILPGKKIIAFEPIKECYDKLMSNTNGINVIAYNCGLSDMAGKTEINISQNFVSSSILPMEDLHKNLYPESTYVGKQTIELKRLDDVISDIELKKNVLLKIDVQGYEEKVIKGGMETLKKVAVIVIEFSYQPLYGGQWLFDDTYRCFTSVGFQFIGVADQVVSKTTGLPLYGDAIFIKKDLLNQAY